MLAISAAAHFCAQHNVSCCTYGSLPGRTGDCLARAPQAGPHRNRQLSSWPRTLCTALAPSRLGLRETYEGLHCVKAQKRAPRMFPGPFTRNCRLSRSRSRQSRAPLPWSVCRPPSAGQAHRALRQAPSASLYRRLTGTRRSQDCPASSHT